MRKGPIYRSSSSSSNTSNTSIKTTGSSASINENNDFESCGGSGGYNNNNNNNNNNDDVTADIINNHRTKTTNVNNNNNNNNNNNINTINNNNNNNLETISLSSHTSSSSFKYLYSVNSISESELEQDYQNERQQFLCDNNNNNNNNHAIGGGGVSGVNKKLTYVQRMKQQFEVLASAEKNSSNNCQKCNWWIKSPQSGIVDNEQFTIETPSAASTTLNESEHIFQRHTRVIKKKSDWLNHRQSNASSAALIENEINNNNINNINANDDDENGCRIVKIKESLICPAVIIPKIDYRQLISDEQKNAIKEEEEAEEEEENVAVVTVEEQEKNEVIENEEEIDENIEVDDTADVVHTINIHSEEQLSDFEENDVQQMSEEIIDTTNQIIFKEVNVHVANDHDIDADDVDADADDNFSDSFDSHTSDEDEDMENKNTLKVQETPRPDSLSSVSSNKLTNIIQELLENEETYIKSLRHGVEGYISIFNERNLPNTLRGQKYSIFGNIERIKSFHANEFYPALQKCSEDIEKIAQTFIKYIQEDYFYYYVLYAINRDKSERMCELNKDFFKERQNTIGDKLGINSFLVQPIQRLPKYSLLLNELIKELGKNLENSKDPIAACCIAQKNIQRLLDTVNESMSINDVIECNDINIHHQGKFQKVSKFDIWDSPLRKKYQGKVFLFDKCVIYTEILDEKRLHFRGYFPRETTGFTFEDGRNKFILYVSKRGQQEIEFSADFTTIQLWIKLLTTMLMKTVELEKQKIEEKRRQRHSTAIEGGTLNVIVRINSANSKHSTSTISNNTNSNSSSSNSSTPWTSGGSRESGASVSSVMSTNSNHSRTSSDSNRTTWYAKLV